MSATRLSSSRFVGRRLELEELETALAQASLRQPALILLGGESGVGKTRLVREFEQRHSEDALVLRGDAVEQGEGELPYAPLLSALRPLVRERHPALEALGRGSRAQLAALLPGLDEGSQPSDQLDPSAQLRLFEAVLELIELLSEDRPLALIFEDMHWADRSTRTFVTYLARSVRQERLVLLLTYRSDELHRRHALRPLLAELERLEHARRIDLAALDRHELAEVLADILEDVPTQALVERLFARSEGNPLYTEELLAAGLDGRGAMPQSLRDAFMLRIERLSSDAQRAVRAIAVGRRLEETVLAEITGIEHDSLHTALREAVAEQVLEAADDGRFLFRHALLREALVDDLLPGERVELHLILARLLEEQTAADEDRQAQLAATIAGHYAAAGDQPAALRATVRAALAARDVHAYGDAADLAERALELWPRVPNAEDMLPLDHVELLRIAAAAHGIAGDRARGEVLLLSALRELDPDRDPRRYSDLLVRLARTQWEVNRGLEAVETAQRALSMLPADEVSHERASLLAWLARTRFLRGRYRHAVEDGEAALTTAVAAGDRHSESEVLNTLGMARICLGDVDRGVADLQRAMEVTRENDDIDGLAYAYANLADTLNIAGRTLEALRVAREGLEQTPRRFTRNRDWMMLTISDIAFEAGDWETARANLGPKPSQMVGRQLILRLIREADLALGVGDEEVAARCIGEAEPLVADSSEPQFIGALGAELAELRRRQRDLLGARAAVSNTLDRLELCTDDVARIARVSAAGARIEADIAQRARDLREKRDERDAIARARIHMQRLRAAAQEGGPVERAWSATGAAELARARGRNDPALWSKAARAWDAIDRPYLAAAVRWREAEAHVEAGERSAATEPAEAALETANRLGSRWLQEEITALGFRARLDLGERASAERDGGPAAEPEDPFGLTPRERQVLALIAEGATNRQIGAALFMAEKTASVHVSRILSKLGVSSRTQAAAVAHRLHLG
ncbi:MAG: AAA family ATPase [Solirubrobacterales bacterium]|nr:AAA family ATPase [Solirubrobacterales bacterium]MBV9424816.1 AAA family ATPase [Solirubrobacterales bacterium]